MSTATKTDLTIANTILSQLGGKRFLSMTGSKDLAGGENYLQMKLSRLVKGMTHLKISYDYNKDLYDVEFFKYNSRKFELKLVKKFNEVYAEDLVNIFEETTMLYTHL